MKDFSCAARLDCLRGRPSGFPLRTYCFWLTDFCNFIAKSWTFFIFFVYFFVPLENMFYLCMCCKNLHEYSLWFSVGQCLHTAALSRLMSDGSSELYNDIVRDFLEVYMLIRDSLKQWGIEMYLNMMMDFMFLFLYKLFIN